MLLCRRSARPVRAIRRCTRSWAAWRAGASGRSRAYGSTWSWPWQPCRRVSVSATAWSTDVLKLLQSRVRMFVLLNHPQWIMLRFYKSAFRQMKIVCQLSLSARRINCCLTKLSVHTLHWHCKQPSFTSDTYHNSSIVIMPYVVIIIFLCSSTVG